MGDYDIYSHIEWMMTFALLDRITTTDKAGIHPLSGETDSLIPSKILECLNSFNSTSYELLTKTSCSWLLL